MVPFKFVAVPRQLVFDLAFSDRDVRIAIIMLNWLYKGRGLLARDQLAQKAGCSEADIDVSIDNLRRAGHLTVETMASGTGQVAYSIDLHFPDDRSDRIRAKYGEIGGAS